MTTTATEAVTLPRATLSVAIDDNDLMEGAEFPYLPVEGAPVGMSGCLILPTTAESGWIIGSEHHASLRPWLGHKGWWVSARQVNVTGEIEITPLQATVALDLSSLPVEYRAAVPDNARWVEVTARIDSLEAVGSRFLAIPRRTPDDYSTLLAWPGHSNFRTFGNRPGCPDGWRGWTAHRTQISDLGPATPVAEIVVGSRVRVTNDGDEPSNNGREATVMEINNAGGERWRVQYDNRQPGGEFGWWVSGVESLTEVTPDPYPVGHWFSWGSRTDWFRISRVDNNAAGEPVRFHSDMISRAGGTPRIEQRDREAGYVILSTQFICVPGDDPEAPVGVREWIAQQQATVAPETVFVPGHWYTWTSTMYHFKVDRVEDGNVYYVERYHDSGGIRRRTGSHVISAVQEREGFIIGPPETDVFPAAVRATVTPELAPTTEALPTSAYHPGQRVEVHGWRTERWNGPATVRRVSDDHVWVMPDEGVSSEGGFVAANIRPLHEATGFDFPIGSRVVLSAPHVLNDTPGTRTYSESPDGIGSTAVITGRSTASGGDCWSIRWEGNDRRSVAHACCLSRIVEAEAPPEPVAGEVSQWDTYYADIPTEYRSQVPVGARWGTPVGGDLRRVPTLFVPDPERMGSRNLYILWPGHVSWNEGYTAHSRPGTPEGWRGFRTADTPRSQSGEPPTVRPGDPTVEMQPFAINERVTAEQLRPIRGALMARSARDTDTDLWVSEGDGSATRLHGDARRMGLGLQHDCYRDDTWVATGWFFRGIDTSRCTTPVPVTGEDTVESLRARLAEVEANYAHDLREIAEVMKTEANERDWCSEYDEVAVRINDRIRGTFDGERSHIWTVNYTTSVRVPVSGRIDVTLPNGASRDDIVRAVRAALVDNNRAALIDGGVQGAPQWLDVQDTDVEVRTGDWTFRRA